nr:MAG TPA: hypothetical protein [Caudoviricetes sp.]
MLAIIVIIPYFHCKIINLHPYRRKKFILYIVFDVNFTLDFFLFFRALKKSCENGKICKSCRIV